MCAYFNKFKFLYLYSLYKQYLDIILIKRELVMRHHRWAIQSRLNEIQRHLNQGSSVVPVSDPASFEYPSSFEHPTLFEYPGSFE